MRRNQLGHLKHRYLLLAAENHFQLGIRIDHAAIRGILQIIRLDVIPDLLGDLGARYRFGADDFREFFGWGDGFGESAVRLAFFFGWGIDKFLLVEPRG